MTEKELLRIINKSKKGNKFSKRIVTMIIAMNVIFTVVVLYLFYLTGNEPMTLIGAWFAFTTVELWSLAFIKKQKEVTKRSEFENVDC